MFLWYLGAAGNIGLPSSCGHIGDGRCESSWCILYDGVEMCSVNEKFDVFM